MLEEIAVDARLCLAVHRASRAMDAVYRPLLEPHELTYAQYAVLSVLWQDGEQTVGSLAQRLSLDPSTLSPLLKRLEERGLVDRRRDERDQRRVHVAATEDADSLRARLLGVSGAICSATGMTSGEQAAMVEQLNALSAQLLGQVAVAAGDR